MPEIQISDMTYAKLHERARSFDDTPEDVIRRLLSSDPGGPPTPLSPARPGPQKPRDRSGRRQRAAPGSILPEREYWLPILAIIAEAGGSAPANDVIDAVEPRLADRLTERDYDVLDMGETRWRNRVRFARLRMKEQRLLSDTSRRGVWEITPLGRQYLHAA